LFIEWNNKLPELDTVSQTDLLKLTSK